ncbi:toprim domain-containing protein [Candidatus Pacearchaeota archaeon]|nr:toprim domain-containing protein [Candidatus Pacearchaeota archaeon]
MKKHEHLALALEDHVEDLMEALDIPLEEYAMSIRDIRGCAPCHDGDNPTAWIYYFDKGKWFCWTDQCHQEYGSDLLGLIRSIKQCTFQEAIKWGGEFLRGKKNPSEKELADKKTARTANKRDFWEEHGSQKVYHSSILRRLDPAMGYAKHRGLSVSLLRRMGVGYARKGRLGGRVVLPIRDVDGHIVGFTGRKIYDNMDGPKWFHKVKTDINLFNLDRAVKAMNQIGSSTIFIVEGPWDMIKMEMAGFPNTVACFGIYLSDGQVEILKKIGVKHVVLALDNDGPAQKELGRMTNKLQKHSFEVSIITPEEDSDFGDKSTSLNDIRSIVAESCPEIKPVRSKR